MTKELFKERVKKDLQNTMEGEQLEEAQQLILLNQALKELLLLENPEVSAVIQKYFDTQTLLQKDIEQLSLQLESKWKQIVENATKIYTSLIKEL